MIKGPKIIKGISAVTTTTSAFVAATVTLRDYYNVNYSQQYRISVRLIMSGTGSMIL